MRNQAILEKAILKAIDGGWVPLWLDKRPVVSWGAEYSTDYDEGEGVVVYGYHARSNASSRFFNVSELIFSHDFAKALWGDGGGGLSQGGNGKLGWDAHLQHMVIADDPIKYLGDNI